MAVLWPIQARAGGGVPPPSVPGDAVFRWVIGDSVGSSLVELDSEGAVVSRTANSPFGREIAAATAGASGTGGRRYFAGHDRRSESGLVYMNAR